MDFFRQAAHQLSYAHQRRDPSEHSRSGPRRELSEQSEALQRRQFRIRRLGPRRSMRHVRAPEWQDGDVRGPESLVSDPDAAEDYRSLRPWLSYWHSPPARCLSPT